MELLRCKMCGGNLNITPDSPIAECLSCGSNVTIPSETDERIINLYNRANYFRQNNEFDKAIGVFESILNERATEAEAHWGLVLCKYGVEYVDDPKSQQKVPTCHRTQFLSILADPNYKEAINHADGYSRVVYEREASEIDQIQKVILEISSKEEPFDVFICYKELDNNGQRTRDSVDAQDIYYALSREGLKVFFSRITLEDKIGSAYEPYIFAALNSAKVMVLVSSSREYVDAPWVKNEWGRFLNIIKKDRTRVLIPAYRNMSPYDFPDELSYLQAMDMSKIGFIQDLVRGIQKIISDKKKGLAKDSKSSPGTSQVSENSLLERAFICLEYSDFSTADSLLEQVLNINPKSPKANLGKLLVNHSATSIDALKESTYPLDKTTHYSLAMQFGDDAQRNELASVNKTVNERLRKAALAEAEKEMEIFQQRIPPLKSKIKDIEERIESQEGLINDLNNVSNKFFFFDIGKKGASQNLSYYYKEDYKELKDIPFLKGVLLIILIASMVFSIWIVIDKGAPSTILFVPAISIVLLGLITGLLGKIQRKQLIKSIINPLIQRNVTLLEELSNIVSQLRNEEKNLQKVLGDISELKTQT